MSKFECTINIHGNDLLRPVPGRFQEWNRVVIAFSNIVDPNRNVKIVHQSSQALAARVILGKAHGQSLSLGTGVLGFDFLS